MKDDVIRRVKEVKHELERERDVRRRAEKERDDAMGRLGEVEQSLERERGAHQLTKEKVTQVEGESERDRIQQLRARESVETSASLFSHGEAGASGKASGSNRAIQREGEKEGRMREERSSRVWRRTPRSLRARSVVAAMVVAAIATWGRTGARRRRKKRGHRNRRRSVCAVVLGQCMSCTSGPGEYSVPVVASTGLGIDQDASAGAFSYAFSVWVPTTVAHQCPRFGNSCYVHVDSRTGMQSKSSQRPLIHSTALHSFIHPPSPSPLTQAFAPLKLAVHSTYTIHR